VIAHVVVFTWKDSVTEEDVAVVYEAHRALAETVDGLVAFHFGPNLGVAPSTADYAVVIVVEDADALRGYLDHPDHVALVEQHTSRMLAHRGSSQISWDVAGR
jgi:hypothetical protein